MYLHYRLRIRCIDLRNVYMHVCVSELCKTADGDLVYCCLDGSRPCSQPAHPSSKDYSLRPRRRDRIVQQADGDVCMCVCTRWYKQLQCSNRL